LIDSLLGEEGRRRKRATRCDEGRKDVLLGSRKGIRPVYAWLRRVGLVRVSIMDREMGRIHLRRGPNAGHKETRQGSSTGYRERTFIGQDARTTTLE
jgi:hypothetical protein